MISRRKWSARGGLSRVKHLDLHTEIAGDFIFLGVLVVERGSKNGEFLDFEACASYHTR